MKLIFRMKKFSVHDAFRNKCNQLKSWESTQVTKQLKLKIISHLIFLKNLHIIYLLHSFECRIYIHPRNTPSLTNVSTQKKWSFPSRISSDLVIFTAEILNGKLYFLCIVYHNKARLSKIFLEKFILATSILLFRWWGVGTVSNYVFLQKCHW